MIDEKRPLIFISNDDGYEAKGILQLIDFLRPLGDLIVMAPDSARSGMSTALTADRPITYQLVKKEPGLVIYKCSGTPTDCVKLSSSALWDRTPDVVIGGINHGDNSAVNVHYSGTMGVVKEGCMKGIPSIGFSLCDHAADADFTPCKASIQKIVATVLEKSLPEGVCLNVNYPKATSFKGVRVCRQTKGRWENEWDEYKRPFGGSYYFLTGEFVSYEQEQEDTEHWALDHGYVAITPTQIDVTAYDTLEDIRNWDL